MKLDEKLFKIKIKNYGKKIRKIEKKQKKEINNKIVSIKKTNISDD